MNSRLGTFAIRAQLFIGRNCISFPLVLNRFEIQQTQIFAFFPMLVGLLADVDRRPIRDDVGSLQQSARIEFARFSVWPEALSFRMVLVGLQQHEEILGTALRPSYSFASSYTRDWGSWMLMHFERIHWSRSDENDVINVHLFGSTPCGYPKRCICGIIMKLFGRVSGPLAMFLQCMMRSA